MERHPDLGDPDQAVFANLTLEKQEQERLQREHDAKYPEHVKLRAIADKSQEIGAFLDWLGDREPALFLCTREVHQGRQRMTYTHADYTIPKLLAEYFEIDQKKIDEEKDAMLEELHEKFTPKEKS